MFRFLNYTFSDSNIRVNENVIIKLKKIAIFTNFINYSQSTIALFGSISRTKFKAFKLSVLKFIPIAQYHNGRRLIFATAIIFYTHHL